MPASGRSWDEILRLERLNFSLPAGLRAAAFVVAPLVLGFETGHPELLLATLGAMFLTNTEGPNSVRTPFGVLLLACFTEAAAFAVGTLAGLTGILAIPLVGLGVLFVLAASGSQTWALAARFTAIFFAVGVGLPGGTIGMAGERLWLALLGGLGASRHIAAQGVHLEEDFRRSRWETEAVGGAAQRSREPSLAEREASQI